MADDASRQRELEHHRATLNALRDPAGAVRLAVQMLAGPLRSAMRDASTENACRVAEVLAALETATGELTHLLSPRGVPNEPVQLVAVPASIRGVEALVASVRDAVGQRVRLRANVDTSVETGLRPDVDGADLQAALVGLLENAIEAMARRRPDGAPWMVELRVTLEPSQTRGVDRWVVFDVRDRGDGLPPRVMHWLADTSGLMAGPAEAGDPGMSLQLARRVAEGAGGHLDARRVGGTTRVRLRVPQR